MAFGINTFSNTASSTQNVLIGSQPIRLALDFNSTDKKWRISIYDSQNDPIIVGVVLSPNKSPTKRYALPFFSEGNLWLFRLRSTDQPLKYDNFGLEKDYGLIYLTNEEEEELGI